MIADLVLNTIVSVPWKGSRTRHQTCQVPESEKMQSQTWQSLDMNDKYLTMLCGSRWVLPNGRRSKETIQGSEQKSWAAHQCLTVLCGKRCLWQHGEYWNTGRSNLPVPRSLTRSASTWPRARGRNGGKEAGNDVYPSCLLACFRSLFLCPYIWFLPVTQQVWRSQLRSHQTCHGQPQRCVQPGLPYSLSAKVRFLMWLSLRAYLGGIPVPLATPWARCW